MPHLRSCLLAAAAWLPLCFGGVVHAQEAPAAPVAPLDTPPLSAPPPVAPPPVAPPPVAPPPPVDLAAPPAPEPAPADPFAAPLWVALGVSLGSQVDSRDCSTAGRSSNFVGTGTCLLFAAGVDLSLLYRGRIGGSLGLYSVSGVAAAINETDASKTPAIPDRISVPMLLEVRPLAYLRRAQTPSYTARALRGVGLALGPSVELVRTSSDQATSLGGQLRLQVEIPLHGGAHHGVSLRAAAHLLIAPKVSLNGGVVRSVNFEPCQNPGCPTLADAFHGYGPVFQSYLGLVYYP